MAYTMITRSELKDYSNEVINFLLDRQIDVYLIPDSSVSKHVQAYVEVNYPLLSERVVIATEEEIEKKTKLNLKQDEICPLSKHILSDLRWELR